MRTTRFITALLLSTLVGAAPIAEKRWGPQSWRPSPASSDNGRRNNFWSCECDLTQAQLPQAPTPLPSPAPGLSLYTVVIGRGTQNYTCDLSNATATPVSIGAVASLFNASCIAANDPQLLAALPSIALSLPIPSSDDPNSPMNQDLAGHHYFTDSKTPYFNLDTSLHAWGQGPFTKTAASSPPSGAMAGQNGKGDGAVSWLQLDTKDSSCNLQQVYRVNTAGGNPPATCAGMSAAFEIQYAAEYWIYSGEMTG